MEREHFVTEAQKQNFKELYNFEYILHAPTTLSAGRSRSLKWLAEWMDKIKYIKLLSATQVMRQQVHQNTTELM